MIKKHTPMNDAWHKRFLLLAHGISGWSRDPKMKVGAVVVRDKRVIATGFNGSASGTADPDWGDPVNKRATVLHAEANAILQAARFGTPLEGATLYCTHVPCSGCAGLIVQAGIESVVALVDHPPATYLTEYAQSLTLSQDILGQAGIGMRLFRCAEVMA